MRGYSDEQVDIFLDEVADEFERLFQENMELQDRAKRLDDQIASHAQIREALEKTLVSAQLQSEEIRANAHKESELILRDAQLKARGIVNDSYGETQKVQQTLVQLKRLEEEFRFKFRSLLEGYLKLLNEAAIAASGGETVPIGSPAAMPTGVAPEVLPVAPEAPVPVVEEPVLAVGPEDEIPTEESQMAALEAEASEMVSQAVGVEETVAYDVTAEEGAEEPTSSSVRVSAGQVGGDEPVRGFFFGRQMEDIDDTFPGEDEIKKDKGRDFEW